MNNLILLWLHVIDFHCSLSASITMSHLTCFFHW